MDPPTAQRCDENRPVVVTLELNPWEYQNTKKMIACVRFDGEHPTLQLEPHVRNRIINTKENNTLNQQNFIHVCFGRFKIEEDDDGRKTKSQMKTILTDGIEIDQKRFLFCGHSNSQIRKRSCIMMEAKNHSEVTEMINDIGNFSTIDDVAKRSKRIGLAFTTAEHIVHLDPARTIQISDHYVRGRNFTDGCGLITQDFANDVFKKYIFKHSIEGLNPNYSASVFQIRYQGYKGTLVTVRGSISNRDGFPSVHVAFRDSMQKFIPNMGHSTSDELYVLDFSKPTGPAHLNGELVSILSSLGIPDHVFVSRLHQYCGYIENASTNKETASEFFTYKCRYKVLKELDRRRHAKCSLEEDEEWIRDCVEKSQLNEFNMLYDKNGIQRTHIMIPQSRLLYGVNDNSRKLKEGQCFVKYTYDRKTLDQEILIGPIVVGRNPCFHPGDIRVFNAVDIPELHHLVDCIVFPISGELLPPAASQMSGGDLDGDRFFVCWDRELIPPIRAPPFDYHAIAMAQKPLKPFVEKSPHLDLINYFVESDNKTLGKLSSLYWEWIRVNHEERAFSKECMEINTLYSKCVDGQEIEIPEPLLNPPSQQWSVHGLESVYILDILTRRVAILLGPHAQALSDARRQASKVVENRINAALKIRKRFNRRYERKYENKIEGWSTKRNRSSETPCNNEAAQHSPRQEPLRKIFPPCETSSGETLQSREIEKLPSNTVADNFEPPCTEPDGGFPIRTCCNPAGRYGLGHKREGPNFSGYYF